MENNVENISTDLRNTRVIKTINKLPEIAARPVGDVVEEISRELKIRNDELKNKIDNQVEQLFDQGLDSIGVKMTIDTIGITLKDNEDLLDKFLSLSIFNDVKTYSIERLPSLVLEDGDEHSTAALAKIIDGNTDVFNVGDHLYFYELIPTETMGGQPILMFRYFRPKRYASLV